MFTERGMTGHIAWMRTGPNVDVLLLHGFSDSAECWAPIEPFLSPRWGLLATDARGHGRSGLPDGPAAPEAMVEDAVSVLKAQPGIRSGGVAVVGHSMGAMTSALLAATHPGLVTALVLEDPPFFTSEDRARFEAGEGPLPRNLDWLWNARALDLETRIARCRRDQPDWPEDELRPWATSKDELDARFVNRRSGPPVVLTEVLAEIRCPVLLLYGDPEKGSLISADSARQCAEACAGELQAVHFAGAGHNVRRDRREPYLEALTGFLDAHLT